MYPNFLQAGLEARAARDGSRIEQRITDLAARASTAERERDAAGERLRAGIAECREKETAAEGAAAAAQEKLRTVTAQLATARRDQEHVRSDCDRFKQHLLEKTRELREARANHAQARADGADALATVQERLQAEARALSVRCAEAEAQASRLDESLARAVADKAAAGEKARTEHQRREAAVALAVEEHHEAGRRLARRHDTVVKQLEAALAERDALANSRGVWATRERELVQALSDSEARADDLTSQMADLLAGREARIKEEGSSRAELDRARIDLARSERKRAVLERQVEDLEERRAGFDSSAPLLPGAEK